MPPTSNNSKQPLVTYTNSTSTPATKKDDEKVADVDEEGGGPPQRETWGKKLDFLLSVIGFAVDLGNVWRFPYVCYNNGGGAFLVPYMIMYIFGGLPLFYMELALGQFQRCGCISVWKRICPMFKGIGFGICVIASYVAMYYNTIIAWSLYFLVSSFRSQVPWATCGNSWNTPNCYSAADLSNPNATILPRPNHSVSAANEFFDRSVLEIYKSTGIHDIGNVKWSIALCLIGVFVLVYFALWKGIKSSGKAVWITATLPYVVLIILLIRGVTLPGSSSGIKYYLKPEWKKLKDPQIWIAAAAQIFFSLGPGFGVLLALSSYNKFHNNCYKDALVTSTINCFTSFLAGFVVFSVLGYMAEKQGTSIEKVAQEGAGLVFVVYPEAIATLRGSSFWAIIFFLMLITLGLDSTFCGLEALITGVCDQWPWIGRKRELFVAGLIVYCFFGALATTTYGGNYVLALLDAHGAPIAILCICFLECIAISWFYGVRRFADDVEKMLGFRPGIFWQICWAGISPCFLFVLFILSLVYYKPIVLGSYVYPDWALGLGWVITASSLIWIPIYIVVRFFMTKGSLKDRWRSMIQPEEMPSRPPDETMQMTPVYL
ncbi:hypothetical protein CAPTEDRAFT_180018 [Capitella teleta]|uniref:Transporter n=1 Tax=Capitella teleta TaxID=283909 RepID=R7VEB2_CAPTE|nr:hypothetical protein CAPTEDRAFT_180018 [Capitella teleta]|eukprot:ELU16974.1 hypothetical protein CAPTEDRAFT_180018 [Capitella teleta]